MGIHPAPLIFEFGFANDDGFVLPFKPFGSLGLGVLGDKAPTVPVACIPAEGVQFCAPADGGP